MFPFGSHMGNIASLSDLTHMQGGAEGGQPLAGRKDPQGLGTGAGGHVPAGVGVGVRGIAEGGELLPPGSRTRGRGKRVGQQMEADKDDDEEEVDVGGRSTAEGGELHPPGSRTRSCGRRVGQQMEAEEDDDDGEVDVGGRGTAEGGELPLPSSRACGRVKRGGQQAQAEEEDDDDDETETDTMSEGGSDDSDERDGGGGDGDGFEWAPLPDLLATNTTPGTGCAPTPCDRTEHVGSRPTAEAACAFSSLCGGKREINSSPRKGAGTQSEVSETRTFERPPILQLQADSKPGAPMPYFPTLFRVLTLATLSCVLTLYLATLSCVLTLYLATLSCVLTLYLATLSCVLTLYLATLSCVLTLYLATLSCVLTLYLATLSCVLTLYLATLSCVLTLGVGCEVGDKPEPQTHLCLDFLKLQADANPGASQVSASRTRQIPLAGTTGTTAGTTGARHPPLAGTTGATAGTTGARHLLLTGTTGTPAGTNGARHPPLAGTPKVALDFIPHLADGLISGSDSVVDIAGSNQLQPTRAESLHLSSRSISGLLGSLVDVAGCDQLQLTEGLQPFVGMTPLSPTSSGIAARDVGVRPYCTAFNNPSCTALNDASCTAFNDPSCTALNDPSCTAFNDWLSSAPAQATMAINVVLGSLISKARGLAAGEQAPPAEWQLQDINFEDASRLPLLGGLADGEQPPPAEWQLQDINFEDISIDDILMQSMQSYTGYPELLPDQSAKLAFRPCAAGQLDFLPCPGARLDLLPCTSFLCDALNLEGGAAPPELLSKDEGSNVTSEEDEPAGRKRQSACRGRKPSVGNRGSITAGCTATSRRGNSTRGRTRVKSGKKADLVDLGRIVALPGWCNAGYVFPSGFLSRTLFRSSVDLTATCIHECTILEEDGEYWPLPTFKVTALDRPDEPCTAKSCTGCWSSVLRRIIDAIVANRVAGADLPPPPKTAVLRRINDAIVASRAAGADLPPPPKTAIAGPEYFGLNQPEVIAGIEALDTEHACLEYWAAKERRSGGQPQEALPPRPPASRAQKPAASNSEPLGGASEAEGGEASNKAFASAQSKKKRGMRGGRPPNDGGNADGLAGDAEDLEAQYTGNRWSAIGRGARYKKRCKENGNEDSCDKDDDNPLPGFIDPITLEPVVNPAISPYGHVMGLATWRAVLAEQGRCPFTKKSMGPEQLTVLNKNNIERLSYRIIQQ
eukprot:gene23727-9280_t